ncbi:MAG: hypothetical protein JW913_03095 [Chitinispirillaceae bacterium]|nr:hypothetical protein [Chitinispirillaceae bacterium]
MNRHESNKMNMFRAVDAVLVQHQSTIDGIQAFTEAAARYRDLVHGIEQSDSEYLYGTEGVTAAKNSATNDVIDRTIPVVNALHALGRKTGDEQLKAETRITESELKHYRREELERRCTHIADLAQAHTADIAAYGITGEMVDAYRKSLETLRLQSDTQQRKIAGSRAAREMLYGKFDATDEVLREDLDRLIEPVKTMNIDFYHQYQAARVIIDHAGRSPKNDSTQEAEPSSAAPSIETVAKPGAEQA